MKLLRELASLFSPRERRHAVLLLFGMVVGAGLEALGVGLMLPFFSLLSRPAVLHDYPRVVRVLGSVGVSDSGVILLLAGLGLFAVYLVKNLYLAALTYFQFRFVYDRQAAMSCRMLDAYMRSPWTFHLQRNTAELLRNVTMEVTLLFGNVVNPLAVLLAEVLVTTTLVGVLVFVDPIATCGSIVLLGGLSYAFYGTIRRRNDFLGKEQQRLRGDMIKWVNQGLGGVKEAKVLGREEFFVRTFSLSSNGYARAARYLATVSQLPRLLLETLVAGGVVLVLAIALLRGEQLSLVVPTLALFGAAAFRLLPSFNRIVASITNIRYHQSAVDVVQRDLAQALDADRGKADGAGVAAPTLEFAHRIQLRNVTFRYPGASTDSLSDVALTIPKGRSVALVGPSGAGKTTLVDVILGLLRPTSGAVLADDRDIGSNLPSWQRRIGYIPQTMYLSDDSIRRNVAFGVPDSSIDEGRVWIALEYAQLAELVRSWPEQLDTLVGERGIRISGGQRQRIGIARALYHDPDVLVLDEATSSLDGATEREIMSAIEKLSGQKTLVIIAHRLTTVERCQLKYWIRDGRIDNVEGAARS